MRKYKERFIWRKIFYSNFTIIFICILIFFVSKGVFKLWGKYEITKTDLEFVKSQEEQAKNRLDLNEEKLKNINTKEGKEKYIRETYSARKEGEEVIVLYDREPSTYKIPKAESYWESFKKYVKKIFDF